MTLARVVVGRSTKSVAGRTCRMKQEILRKSIHLTSLLIPFGYKYWLGYDKQAALLWIGGVFCVFFAYEHLRKGDGAVGKVLHKHFAVILREHEKSGSLAGSFYLLVSCIFCVGFFSGEVAFLSLSFLSLGDSLAALVGKRFGKIRLGDKSLEGSLACFAGCLILVYFFADRGLAPELWLFWWTCTGGALAATLAELIPTKVDDNLKMPVVASLVMTMVLKIGGQFCS